MFFHLTNMDSSHTLWQDNILAAVVLAVNKVQDALTKHTFQSEDRWETKKQHVVRHIMVIGIEETSNWEREEEGSLWLGMLCFIRMVREEFTDKWPLHNALRARGRETCIIIAWEHHRHMEQNSQEFTNKWTSHKDQRWREWATCVHPLWEHSRCSHTQKP